MREKHISNKTVPSGGVIWLDAKTYLYAKLWMVIKRQSNPSHGDPHVDMCTYTQKGAQFASFQPSWEPMTKFYKRWENEKKKNKNRWNQ